MDIESFFMGLLLALSARGCQVFNTWGEKFHQAFVATVHQAQQTAPVPVEDIDWLTEVDRGFGNSVYAEQMIVFGMSARLLTLDSPDLIRARLRPWPHDIKIREQIGHVEWFDALAETFHAAVATTRAPAPEDAR